MAGKTFLKNAMTFFVFFVVFAVADSVHAKIIYVDDDGPADFSNIQAAIDNSNHGDTIVVSPGTYTGDGNRDIDYNGKAISVRSENGPENCIIDCQSAGRGFHFQSGENANSVLSGFTITNGYVIWNGGGIYCINSSPTLTNCIFSSNSAGHEGGGMYNYKANPILTDCTFSSNSSGHAGGGMENFDSSPTLTNCTFSSNSSGHAGGGMCNYHSSSNLTNCAFNENSADFQGGGIENINSNIKLTNCTFSSNSSGHNGGGMENDHSSLTLTDCMFSSNSSVHSGGGMENINSSTKLTNCTFSSNSSGHAGGGMENFDSSTKLTNCTFSSNSSGHAGGAINNFDSSPTLTDCTFIANTSKSGGGMFNYRANSILTDCTFSSNLAESNGGGIYTMNGNLTLINCNLSGNSAGNRGGGIYNWRSAPTLTNCTFAGNSAPRGKALACDSFDLAIPSDLQMTNCILWGGGDQISNIEGSTITINYSDVQGGWPGKGNIDADPYFVEPGYWDANGVWIDGDYHLLQDSPCIDTGDPNYVAQPNETDLDGKPRVMGGRIDMGAYESPIPAEARILPQTINLASKGNWITCYIWLPHQYNVTDIEPNSVFLEGEIKPEQFSVDEQQQVATARFTREDVHTILEVGDIELTITGQLTDGTIFEGTDTIKVTDKARKE